MRVAYWKGECYHCGLILIQQRKDQFYDKEFNLIAAPVS